MNTHSYHKKLIRTKSLQLILFTVFALFFQIAGMANLYAGGTDEVALAIKNRDWKEVTSLAEKLVKEKPDNVWTNYYMGLGLTNIGNFADGETYLNKAIAIDPKHFWSHYLLFYNYRGQNNINALSEASTVESLISNELTKDHAQDIQQFYASYAGMLSDQDKKDEARQILARGLEKFKGNPQLSAQYAFTYFREDQKKWAELSRKTLDLVPANERKAILEYQIPIHGTHIKIHQGNNSTISHLGLSNGYDWDFVLTDENGHYGANTSRKEGNLIFNQPVYAAADGKVVKVFDKSKDTDPLHNDPEAEANTIVIQHPNEEYSVYLHLKEKSALVKTGDQVKVGQMIAHAGCTGRYVDFPHLHFGIRRNDISVEAKLTGFDLFKNGVWTNPGPYVPKEGDVLRTH